MELMYCARSPQFGANLPVEAYYEWFGRVVVLNDTCAVPAHLIETLATVKSLLLIAA